MKKAYAPPENHRDYDCHGWKLNGICRNDGRKPFPRFTREKMTFRLAF